ncbi:unnamed protein product [Lepeophtheirus salmonis]|uniref:(salmon louse) hypothetical protein n=1 Tax=Lepeophtheirus salmonis TaxID=72036 RepID=A0A7R8H303_LEPSM|nr:unnamed protein product [Lepeophtheirus salmonis]CAF2823632.1 unnamed protein product [Lepeophtheirus salmonis]
MDQSFNQIYFEGGAVSLSIYQTYEAITLMMCAILCQASANCFAFKYDMNECNLINRYFIKNNSTNLIYIKDPCSSWNYGSSQSAYKTERYITQKLCYDDCFKKIKNVIILYMYMIQKCVIGKKEWVVILKIWGGSSSGIVGKL